MYFLEFLLFFPSLDSASLYDLGTFFTKLYSQSYIQSFYFFLLHNLHTFG